MLRDAIVPLVHMHTLLDLPHVATTWRRRPVLVVRFGGTSVGLVVDSLREGIDVILKPMEGFWRGYAATQGRRCWAMAGCCWC